MIYSLVFFLFTSLPVNLPQQQQLIGSWKVTEMLSNGKPIGDMPMDISLQFLPDGRVMAYMGEKTEAGRWKIEGEFLILIQPKITEKFRFQVAGNRMTMIKDSEMIVFQKTG